MKSGSTGIWRYIARQINMWFYSRVIECRGGIPEALGSNEPDISSPPFTFGAQRKKPTKLSN